MKQKYSIQKNNQSKEFILQESAELDKELFSLLCEETYPFEVIESAATQGKEALFKTLRTKNMFPIGLYAVQITEAVMDLLESKSDDVVSRELFFDDIELLRKDQEAQPVLKDTDSESAEIDKLLEADDTDTEFDDDDIDDITYPIKVADDDAADPDDED